MDVLTLVSAPALFTDENLCCLVVVPAGEPEPRARQQRRLVHRLCAASATILGPHFGDYDAAFRFGQLGFDLVEKRGPLRCKARVYF